MKLKTATVKGQNTDCILYSFVLKFVAVNKLNIIVI